MEEESVKLYLLMGLTLAGLVVCAETIEEATLRAEVRGKGWIAYASRTEKGDMDIFLCRPDGGSVRNITQTPDLNEGLLKFSPDGKMLLFRRLPRSEKFDNNNHGSQGVLMISHSDGTQAKPLGASEQFPWASWSPDGKQILCLTPKGFNIVDCANGQTIRTFPRKGFFQQSTWSPDGQWLVGVANSFGESWSIARMNIATGEAMAVNKHDCCTPDWFPDNQNIIFSWRPAGQQANNRYGWTQLWRNSVDGKEPQLVYGEDGRHVYGGHVSPDGKYALFTGNIQEDGDPGSGGSPMGLMRLSDAPLIGGASPALRAKFPKAKSGPVLVLPSGWEHCWTLSEAPAGAGGGQP
jgi:Tol biopolymer transport system component